MTGRRLTPFKIVARATELGGADAGVIYEYDTLREVFEPRASERLEDEIVRTLVSTPIRKGQGATGQLAEGLQPVQLPDIATGERILVRDLLIHAGYRALLALPLAREGHLIGALTVSGSRACPFRRRGVRCRTTSPATGAAAEAHAHGTPAAGTRGRR